jgi:hypothetical protein
MTMAMTRKVSLLLFSLCTFAVCHVEAQLHGRQVRRRGLQMAKRTNVPTPSPTVDPATVLADCIATATASNFVESTKSAIVRYQYEVLVDVDSNGDVASNVALDLSSIDDSVQNYLINDLLLDGKCSPSSIDGRRRRGLSGTSTFTFPRLLQLEQLAVVVTSLTRGESDTVIETECTKLKESRNGSERCFRVEGSFRIYFDVNQVVNPQVIMLYSLSSLERGFRDGLIVFGGDTSIVEASYFGQALIPVEIVFGNTAAQQQPQVVIPDDTAPAVSNDVGDQESQQEEPDAQTSTLTPSALENQVNDTDTGATQIAGNQADYVGTTGNAVTPADDVGTTSTSTTQGNQADDVGTTQNAGNQADDVGTTSTSTTQGNQFVDNGTAQNMGTQAYDDQTTQNTGNKFDDYFGITSTSTQTQGNQAADTGTAQNTGNQVANVGTTSSTTQGSEADNGDNDNSSGMFSITMVVFCTMGGLLGLVGAAFIGKQYYRRVRLFGRGVDKNFNDDDSLMDEYPVKKYSSGDTLAMTASPSASSPMSANEIGAEAFLRDLQEFKAFDTPGKGSNPDSINLSGDADILNLSLVAMMSNEFAKTMGELS